MAHYLVTCMSDEKITNKNSFLLRGKDTTLINQALASYATKQIKDSSSWFAKSTANIAAQGTVSQ